MSFTAPQLLPVLLDRLAPWLTSATDPTGDHAALLTAKAAMGQQLWGLVMDQGDDPDDPAWVPGWGALFDVDICPTQYLPFLAQIVGVQIPTGTSDPDARAIIRAEQGMQRGTLATIKAAAVRNLTTSFLVVKERTAADGTTDAYHVVIGFNPADLATTEQALINAVEAVKPGGIQITYVQSAGYTWDEAMNTWSADTFTWAAAFATQP